MVAKEREDYEAFLSDIWPGEGPEVTLFPSLHFLFNAGFFRCGSCMTLL